MLIDGWDKLDEFLAHGKAHMPLRHFGGHRNKFGADALKTDGRPQHPVYDGEGLSECGILFETMLELLPECTVFSEASCVM